MTKEQLEFLRGKLEEFMDFMNRWDLEVGRTGRSIYERIDEIHTDLIDIEDSLDD